MLEQATKGTTFFVKIIFHCNFFHDFLVFFIHKNFSLQILHMCEKV